MSIFEFPYILWQLSAISVFGDAHISPVIEWSVVAKVLSKIHLNLWKLCLSERFYIINSLNDPNLLNKNSELVNNCRHQWKLLLKSFKKNQYSERNDTMDLFLIFDISSSGFDVSKSCNTFYGILTYLPFRKSILFFLSVYTASFSKSFKVVYSLIGR